METSKLKKFAQFARRSLIEQVSGKLKLVLAEGSAARRESSEAVIKLEEQIKTHGDEKVVEKIAYIWFNRFCALRFMDVNHYTLIGVVSPADGQFQPEILAEAKRGHIDDSMVPEKTRHHVFALLNGTTPSSEPQAEAYRMLVVAACNDYHKAMPYLFERIADYTELLMPDDLLSGNSILAYTREAMTPDVCNDVEVIGWLYQFYISEKKDKVFEGLKKNQKITPENIPAATQLFTPHWIVRYLVENSLGRLWMLNRPNSRLVEQMEYYIKPAEPEADFLKINSPEEIKICDPACGSGHMLTYAFVLLYAIYEEAGNDSKEIPDLILTKNLYGIEIDERAGALAAFALTMKARQKNRRFFRKPVQPNICVLKNIHFDESELQIYMDALGRSLFTMDFQTTLHQFEEADNFGSLIRPALTDTNYIHEQIKGKGIGGQIHLYLAHQKVLQMLRQADFLSPKYHVVLANPPYMGSKGMNGRLQAFAKDCYTDSKPDLFTMFIERNIDLVKPLGSIAMITMQSWMFLSAFEKFRKRLITEHSIMSMTHLGARAFDSIGGEIVSTTAFVIGKSMPCTYKGAYLRLVDGECETEKDRVLKEKRNYPCYFNNSYFLKIPGYLIAYWVSGGIIATFSDNLKLGEYLVSREGLTSGDNERFLRVWSEVGIRDIFFHASSDTEAKKTGARWFPHLKGGEYRKWAGNTEFIVDWFNDGQEMKNFSDLKTGRIRSHNYNGDWAFKTGLTWSSVSTGNFCVRHVEGNSMFDTTGTMGFANQIVNLKNIESYLNSKVATHLMSILAPTIRFQPGHALNLPYKEAVPLQIESNGLRCVELTENDWDSYETSWKFNRLPLLHPDYRQPTLKATYVQLCTHWSEMTLEMQRLEEENNRIFIEAYGLQDELSPNVPLNEITLTCNPHYRYGGAKTEEELEALLLADTMREFIAYAVGCMFGRYALDMPGLILANQGETIEDYLKQIPKPSFSADDDNVIPVLDDDWFIDDIASRFHKFLKITFGEEHFEENLKFIEKAIGKDIRKYFLKDFYDDHVRRYKKRPIYWLFSSPKGSFNALIYMHRYRPDTVSIVLNDYLREFRTKLISRREHLAAISISASASQTEKTKALKEIEKLKKTIDELNVYERDILYPLATRKIEIDLDDGVKVNYLKFGAALKKITGLDTKEE